MKKKIFFTGLFIVSAIGLFIFASIVLKQNNTPEYVQQTNLRAPIDIPSKNIVTYQEAEQLDKPIVAMFYVDWCAYCRRFMPIFGEFANKYKDKYSFAAINCDNPSNMNLAKDFHILGFPTLFIIDKKIDHKFPLNIAATAEKSVMVEELDNYLKVRKKLVR